jgi:general L-amino acid transport system permease protein
MLAWIRKHLFGSVFDSLVTLVILGGLALVVPRFVQWAFLDADFLGTSRADCTGDGACWVFIKARYQQFLYGFYPEDQRWRPNLALLAGVLGVASLAVKGWPYRKLRAVLMVLVYPYFVYRLIHGGILGLEEVETSKWGGLMLTMILGVVGLVGSLPLGTLLALGRRSPMPVIRKLSIAYIELWRGVPLITVLFMASVMLPLFLPSGVDFDKLLRALVGVTLFSSAYMAEAVRGGLEGVPKGQYEAAEALGLGYWRTMGLIILPQALKKMLPGIVNTCISLVKDTTLVLVIGMFDLLGMVQTTLTDPEWLGYSTEGYVFVAAVFWVFCFGMSRYSMRLERRLNTERKA